MSFAALIEARARDAPDQPAIVTPRAVWTRGQLDRRAGAVAHRLAAQGARPGDRVALFAEDAAEFAAALLGTLKLGAIAVPLSPRLVPAERERVLADLEPRAVLTDIPGGEAERPAVRRADAPALILYTSGSTGAPKGSVLSHRALTAAIESWAGPVMDLGPHDRVLAVLPLAHSFGLNGALLAPLWAGATVVALDAFAPDAALEAIERHRVTVLPAVATMFRRLLDAPGFAAARLDSLRFGVSGAAPCSWELADEWRRRAGARILRGYGMTELFRPISYLAGDADDRPNSIGRAVPGVELRIVDDAGATLGDGAAGELLIRTPAAMDGYLHAEAETRAVLSEGWFSTGDLACISPEGWVSIVGRKKDLILRGGFSVVPAEVEAVLQGHPWVAEAAVVGVPNAELGEEVAAFVTLRPSTPEAGAPDELIAWCRERLAPYKRPRRLRIVADLPRSPTGKILKSRLTDDP